MENSLSPELMTLCEWASHESDPKKLLAVTKRINELLRQAKKRKLPNQTGIREHRRCEQLACEAVRVAVLSLH